MFIRLQTACNPRRAGCSLPGRAAPVRRRCKTFLCPHRKTPKTPTASSTASVALVFRPSSSYYILEKFKSIT